ncbi:TcpQ domain-containing protein [Arsenophonus nasoniae]|uniref:Cag pathogenicity island Cag12 family protein n=1 Tax=Arsenophonus nasoniae TaxID=638 RepID=A0ABY8NXI3_9GAMM|nr:cag pathogenicity island Cag12 family protein [Arsenophonus nasoniae]WGM08744.1 cag pathogenicity island Cag12 family protein [Arsenophonus nasoniae]
MKFIVLTVGGMMLAGCSSPPPPPPVNWSGSAIEINSTMPDWKENNVVIPSPIITGHWAKAIYDFDGEKGNYLPDDYFAVAHANQIVVLTQTSAGYFNAKRWLRTHGAKGVIDYQVKQGCIGCSETDIYFYRIDKPVDIHPIPVKKKTERMLPEKKLAKDNHSMTSKPLTVIQAPKINSVKNNASPSQENKPLVHSQPMIAPPKTTTLLTNKPLTAMKVTPKPKPVQTWQIEKDVTLKDGVMAWAIKESCIAPGVKNWTVYWQTSINYQIDAPLNFSGDFKSALRSVLELYQSAKKPLYAETSSAQCLIRITDKPPGG